MKKLKNLLMIIVIAISTVLVMPANVFASDELITEVRVTMNPIKVGNTISMTATLTAEPAAAVSRTNMPLNWAKSDSSDGSSSEIVTSGTFEADKYYWWNFDYGFNSGYYTDSTTKYYVNDVEYVYNSWVQPETIKITEIKLTGPEIRDGYAIPSTVNIESTPKEAISATSVPFNWHVSDTILSSVDTLFYFLHEMPETGNFIEGKYYTLNPYTLNVINPGYEIGYGAKYYYNGEEISAVSSKGVLSFTWIQAKEAYSYEYIEGNNQEFTKGKISSYTYKIDGDNLLFETIKINGEEFIKDADYTVTKGSTIITFTTTGVTKLNTLNAGTYNVETKFTDNIVTGKLIIKDEAKQEEKQSTEEDSGTDDEVEREENQSVEEDSEINDGKSDEEESAVSDINASTSNTGSLTNTDKSSTVINLLPAIVSAIIASFFGFVRIKSLTNKEEPEE